MEGSVDKTAEAKVQRSERKMMRSNFDPVKPVFLVAILRKIQPRIAIAIPITLAATECGANTTYNKSPRKMSFWLNCANKPWLESDLSKRSEERRVGKEC